MRNNQLYLDTEFNGHGGDLISLALAAPSGNHWYCELPLPTLVHAWVAEHVVPKLTGPSVPLDSFRHSLRNYLLLNPDAMIYADWPDDLAYLMHLMSGSSFEESWMIPLTFELLSTPAGQPKPHNPHNALSDAIALMEWHQARIRDSWTAEEKARLLARQPTVTSLNRIFQS